MASSLNIHLGSDAVISYHILPTYQLNIRYTIKSHYINICMVYYYNNREILTHVDFNMQLQSNLSKLIFINDLKELISSLDDNSSKVISINDMHVNWSNNMWIIKIVWLNNHGDSRTTTINLALCDDSKIQFKRKMRGLLYVINHLHLMGSILPEIKKKRELYDLTFV